MDAERPGDKAGKRAAREAVAAARLGHPAIVALYEAGRDDDGWVLVSELVRGRTLAQLEHDGALSDRDVLRIGATLCDALAHAHARGVVHRDVKPSNVICPEASADGAAAKLTDFGIARLADDDAVTRTGDVVGTLAYMAPEQARGEHVTAAADTYALGLVIYEALSGVNPIRGAGAAETVARIGERIPPLRRARRDLPADVCDAVDAAVRARPEDRIAPSELGAVLLAALPDVADEPGVVGGGTLEGATRVVDATRRLARERGAPRPDLDPRLRARLEPLDPRLAAPTALQDEPAPRRGITLPGRAVGAVAGGALTLLMLDRLDGLAGGELLSTGQTPVAIAGAVAVALFVFPRLAWLAAAAATFAWVAEGTPGLALLLAAALLPVPFLLWRSGWSWSLLGRRDRAGADRHRRRLARGRRAGPRDLDAGRAGRPGRVVAAARRAPPRRAPPPRSRRERRGIPGPGGMARLGGRRLDPRHRADPRRPDARALRGLGGGRGRPAARRARAHGGDRHGRGSGLGDRPGRGDGRPCDGRRRPRSARAGRRRARGGGGCRRRACGATMGLIRRGGRDGLTSPSRTPRAHDRTIPGP